MPKRQNKGARKQRTVTFLYKLKQSLWDEILTPLYALQPHSSIKFHFSYASSVGRKSIGIVTQFQSNLLRTVTCKIKMMYVYEDQLENHFSVIIIVIIIVMLSRIIAIIYRRNNKNNNRNYTEQTKTYVCRKFLIGELLLCN